LRADAIDLHFFLCMPDVGDDRRSLSRGDMCAERGRCRMDGRGGAGIAGIAGISIGKLELMIDDSGRSLLGVGNAT